ncbi:MAG: type IVB secretion system protein IcmH/DotU, partial [Billgrantia sp.]
QVMAARYVLCTVVDEAVVTTPWGNESQWSQMSLLSSFHNETFGGEKFFQLLERLSRNPVKHLPMLELMYLCLSLGFEGKYRVLQRGMLELEAVRDSLYRQIRQLRGDVPREVSPHWQGLKDTRRRLVRIVPWWLVALFTLMCLVMMYAGFAWVLGEQRDTVLKPYQQLDPASGVSMDDVK